MVGNRFHSQKFIFLITLIVLIFLFFFIYYFRYGKYSYDYDVFNLKCLKKRSKYLVVGVSADYIPYAGYNTIGELEGIDIDIMKEIALRNNLTLVFKEMDYHLLITSLKNKNIDIVIGGLTSRNIKDKEILFTNVYFSDLIAMVTKKNLPNILVNINYLKNLKTLVVDGYFVGEYLEDKGYNISYYESQTAIINAILENKNNVYLTSKLNGAELLKEFDKLNLYELYDNNVGILKEHYSFLILSEKETLIDMINNEIDNMRNDGSIDLIVNTNT